MDVHVGSGAGVAAPTVGTTALLDDALSGAGLRMLFQPIVDLRSGELVGHEALARGPVGSPLELPTALFAAAQASGRVQQLDWACRGAAFEEGLRAHRPWPWRMFVNADPRALNTACPQRFLRAWVRAHRELKTVVEVTERCLMHRPADLVRVIATMRELGWEIALDDTGANDASVAMLPVLQPDIVKLDRPLLADRPSRHRLHTLRAIHAYVERSGAILLAEGIENERELEVAHAIGATWGQGFYFGRPAPLEAVGCTSVRPARQPRSSDATWDLGHDATPFQLLARDEPTLLVDDGWLVAQLEVLCHEAARAPESAVLLLAVGALSPLPRNLYRVLDELQDVCALVAVTAVDTSTRRSARVRMSALPAHGRWSDELSAVLLSPATTRVLSATRLPDGRHEAIVGTDASRVAATARLLLARVAPV